MSRRSRTTVDDGMARVSKRSFIIGYLRSFNLFRPYPPSTSDYDIQNELISTRIFLLLLILCTLVLVIYISQENAMETITVNEPNFDQFRELVLRYPETLNCPCENIAIIQNTFISLYPDFHQVCSSDFVSSKWIMHINAAANRYISKDFSYTGGPLFQALATFCNLAKASLTNSLFGFNSTRFISVTALSKDLFDQRVQSLIDGLKTTAIGTFILSFNMIREMTHSSSLMSGLLTNAKVDVHPLFLLAGISFEYYNNGTCNCFLTPSCLAPLTRQQTNSSMLFTIPGLYIGCYLVEAMRNSLLECFYNQSCLDQVEFILHSPVPFGAAVLDPSLSKFAVNSTVDALLSQAMIEQWNQNVSWSNYYKQCKPATCTYSFIAKHNIWFIITTTIGLIGGLVEVLRFFVPHAIKFIRKRICRAKPTPPPPPPASASPLPTSAPASTSPPASPTPPPAPPQASPPPPAPPQASPPPPAPPQASPPPPAPPQASASPQASPPPPSAPPTALPATEPDDSSWLKKLLNLNIFQSIPPSTDWTEIRKQVISTRLFIYLCIVCIAFFLTYLSLDTVITTDTTILPSYNQFRTLYTQHSQDSLSCSCSSLVIEYQDIMQIMFKLHPVCSSDFVQPPWVNFLISHSGLEAAAFRTSAPPIFQTLASYCRLTANYIQTNLQTFNTTQMITPQALGEFEFHAQVNTTINAFITSMINSFLRSLGLITKTSRANGIVSAQATNFYPYVGGTTSLNVNYNSSLLNFLYRPNQGCYCFPSISCLILMTTYESGLDHIVESMMFYSGCLPDEGFRRSSLSALFDPILVDYMNLWYDFPPNTAKILNISHLVEFNVESSVEEILSKIMVNQWNLTSFHDVYYEKCRPKICTYIQVDRKSFLVIFTSLIGLLGGLASVLQIIVPRLVQIMFFLHSRFTRERRQEQTVAERMHFSLKASMLNLLSKLRRLNLFPSLPPATEEAQIKTELISTRIFILLFISSTLIVTIYSARTVLIKTEMIPSPSIDVYRSLYISHSDTLSCPCTNISIARSTFLTLRPTFHQVCSSNLVNSRWIVGIISSQSYGVLVNTMSSTWYDFRLLGGSFFLTVALLCEVMNKTITDGLISFGASSIITNHVMSENELNAQGLALMDLFIATTTNDFINSLRIIRETTQANVLISGYATNIQMAWDKIVGDSTVAVVANYTTFFNCSCADSPLCSQEAGIYEANGVFQFSIPGVRIGCYAVEAALQSSLSTFYNQTWIDDFRNWTRFINPYFKVKALNTSLNHNFAVNASIESMIEQLMVDEWINKNVSFSNYYAQCQPFECKYTYTQANDIVYMITTIISVIGGLKVVLYFVIPRAVAIARRWYLKRRSKVVSITIQVE